MPALQPCALIARLLAQAGGPQWQTWPDALQQAQQQDLPLALLLLSPLEQWSAHTVQELARDDEVCALVSQAFVPCVLDASRAPAWVLRAHEALAVLANAAGIPAWIFLTPEGKVFGAQPWRPLRDRDGQRGLVHTLLAIAEAWQVQPDAVRADAAHLEQAWQTLHHPPPARSAALWLGQLEAHILEQADTLVGGFGGTPRHAQVGVCRFVLARCAQGAAVPALRQALERALAMLVAGGLHDHIGGGFFRVCLDPGWDDPSWDKRASDNLQLIPLLLQASAVLQEPAYRHVACSTWDWLQLALVREDGLFAAGLHALSGDGAGAFRPGAAYLWRPSELVEILGREGARIVLSRFGDSEGPQDEAQALRVRQEIPAPDARRLPELCARLRAARAERPLPPCDHSALLADQGRALYALAALQAAQALPEADSAQRFFQALTHALAAAPEGLPLGWEADGIPFGRACRRSQAWLAVGAAAWGAHNPQAFALARDALSGWHIQEIDSSLSIPSASLPDDAEGPSALALAAQAAALLQQAQQADQESARILELAQQWRGLCGLSAGAASLATVLMEL